MNRKLKKIFISTIIIFVLYLTSNSILANNTATIEIIPEFPEPESEIEIKAFIDIDDIEQVYTEIQECNINTGICYIRSNISLTKINDNTYKTSFKLTESRATYIQYNLLVKTDLGWETLIKEEKTNLFLQNNNGNDGNGNEETPGFGIIGILLGFFCIILLFNKRKR